MSRIDGVSKAADKLAKKASSDARMKEEVELDEKCWKGYEKKGMKTMFGKRYPNCVKKKVGESVSNWRDEIGYEGKDDLKKLSEDVHQIEKMVGDQEHEFQDFKKNHEHDYHCLLYTSPSPRDR